MSEATIDSPKTPEWIVLSNARRIGRRQYQRMPNWALAMEIFGLGSTYATALCRRNGFDPDGKTSARAAGIEVKEIGG